MFGKWLANAGFGGGKKQFGNDRPEFGEEKKNFMPPADDMGGDMEGKGDEDKEKKPESDKEEGVEEETIEQIIELYDQITPLIDKLRKS